MTNASVSGLRDFVLDPALYPGGIALWGALPAVYDTTSRTPEHGVHLHARKRTSAKKDIDQSFAKVEVLLSNGSVAVREKEAMSYVAAAVLDLPMSAVRCPFCDECHVDQEEFAVRPHEEHLCENCSGVFLESHRSIANPLIALKKELNDASTKRPTIEAEKPLSLSQSDSGLSGGILIWGTNPAVLWTADRLEEEGIHVHAFKHGCEQPIVDGTFKDVQIDGIALEPATVRVFMVQQSIKCIRRHVCEIRCPYCGLSHFDDCAPFAVKAHTNHTCVGCGDRFTTKDPAIGNPLVGTVRKLYLNAQSAGLLKNPLAP